VTTELLGGGALDLEAETTRRKKPKTDSTTGASMVDQLRRLGFKPYPTQEMLVMCPRGNHNNSNEGSQGFDPSGIRVLMGLR
jgi:hypothetical protein